MDKQTIRTIYKEKRKTLTEEVFSEVCAEVTENLKRLLNHLPGEYYHVFLPIVSKREFDTGEIIRYLQQKGKSVVVSKSDFRDCSMKHYLLCSDTQIEEGAFAIPEPVLCAQSKEVGTSQIDVVIVPLLAFDQRGFRVGYGKGFYDRFLKGCPAKTIALGVSLFEPVERIEDVHGDDCRLDYCVTPQKTHHFSGLTD